MFIYAFSISNCLDFEGCIKIGEAKANPEERVKQQIGTFRPVLDYKIEFAVQVPDSVSDKDVHKYLKAHGVEWVGQEWFRCTPEQALIGIISVLSDMRSPVIEKPVKKEHKKSQKELRAINTDIEKTFSEKFPMWYKQMEGIGINLKTLYPILKEFKESDITNLRALHRVIELYGGENPENILYNYLGVEGFPSGRLIDNLRALANIQANHEKLNKVLRDLREIDPSSSVFENFTKLLNIIPEWDELKILKDDIILRKLIENNEWLLREFSDEAGFSEGHDAYIQFGNGGGAYLSELKGRDIRFYKWFVHDIVHTLKCILFVQTAPTDKLNKSFVEYDENDGTLYEISIDEDELETKLGVVGEDGKYVHTYDVLDYELPLTPLTPMY